MRRTPILLAALLAALPAAPVAAQNSLPGLENFTLERPQPPAPTATPTAQRSPTAVPTTTPSPTPSQPAPTASAVPTPRASPRTQSVAPSPTATATPAPVAAATALPTPLPSATPTAAPSKVPTPEPVTAAPATGWWPWVAGGALVLLALIAVAWFRTRRTGTVAASAPAAPRRQPAASTPVEPRPTPPPPPTPAPRTPATPGGLVTSSLKPVLESRLFPMRAGVDTLRATLEYGLQLGNSGRAAAREVAVEAWLLSASHDTGADLARLFAGPRGEPMIPPFDLPATAAIDLSGLVTAPRETLATITAGERRLFVPVLGVRIGYRDGRGNTHVQTAAFLIGVEREGQDRLAPLPLDRGAAMREGLAARPYPV